MPFRDPITRLVLPPGVTPPTVGESAIVLDPGPPPVIQFYTGDADESAPAQMQSAIVSGKPQLQIIGPDVTASTNGPSSLSIGIADAPNNESFVEWFAEDFAFYDSLATPLLQLHGADSFEVVYEPFVSITQFQTNNTRMEPVIDVSGTATNGLTNTGYATPTNSVGLAFVAPPSGRGLIHYHGRFDLNYSFAAGTISERRVYCAPALRNGATIGSGSDPSLMENGQPSPADSRSFGFGLIQDGTHSIDDLNQNGLILVEGLTPGGNYNIFLQWRCSNGASFTYDVKSQTIVWQPFY